MPVDKPIPGTSNQPPVDTGAEISPDGNPTGEVLAAPKSTHEIEPKPTDETPPKSMEDLSPASDEQPKVDEEGKPIVDFTEFIQNKNVEAPEVKPPVKTEEAPKLSRKDKVQQDLSTRNLEGIPDELQPHFKQEMSREAFDKITPLVKEHRALKAENEQLKTKVDALSKNALPDNYYEHPSGFILDSDYLATENNAALANQILNHWQ